MLPPAPARFSTTTCWPRSSPKAGATMRAVVSVPPPGSKPTTVVTGLAGYPCAVAPCAMPSAASAANTRFICILLVLAASEDRLSLFHEGAAAFGVILAREALLDPRGAGGCIVIALADLANDAFRRAHRERRVGSDHVAIGARRGLELRDRHHLVHEPHAQRLLRAELARGDHDLERARLADQIDQVLHRARAVAEAHLGGGNAEARVVRGNAQVAKIRDVEPAAEAVAADHGDGRLVELGEPCLRALADLLVARDRLRARALLLELRDVGARDERLVARAGEHHCPHVGVRGKVVERARHCLPHVERDRVAPLRVVEDEPADRALLAADETLRAHTTPCLRSSATSPSLYSSSRRISSVCWPISGVAVLSDAGVRESFTAWLRMRMRPSRGCSTSAAAPRCLTCGSANTSSIL